jgi:hypothetical protein
MSTHIRNSKVGGADAAGNGREIFVVNRGPIGLGVAAMPPVETFEAKAASVNTAILEVAVRVAPWLERTRLVPFSGPGYDETLASLLAQGYKPTSLAQASTLRAASWFPFRSLSFAIRGDSFYAPLADGRVASCCAVWDHAARRFDVADIGARPAEAYDALTRVEKIG